MTELRDPLEQSTEEILRSDDEQTVKTKKAANVEALLQRGSANDKLKSALKKLQEAKAKKSGDQAEVPPKKVATKVTKKVISKPVKPEKVKLLKTAHKKTEPKKSLTLASKKKVEKPIKPEE